jgi:hypothetical protein
MQRLTESVAKERSAKRALADNIEEINKQAKQIIDGQIMQLKEMELSLKKILDDYHMKTPAVIANLKKIRAGSNRQFIEEIVQAYKDIFWLLKLLSNYTSLRVTEGREQQNGPSEG